MDPLDAVMSLAPIATECINILVLIASPRLHPKLRSTLPPGTTAEALHGLFGKFAQAAKQFEANEGLLEGAEQFMRAARTLTKIREASVGWQPMVADPPEKVVEHARTALRYLGVTEPEGGWDDYGADEPPPNVH